MILKQSPSIISYLVIIIATGLLIIQSQQSVTPANYDHRISYGDNILIRSQQDENKQQGTRAIAQNNYSEAVEHLESAWKQSHDPETLIYLNNARIGEEQALEVAVTIPIDGEGDTLFFGMEMLRGYAQAQQKINQAGGINGTPLKLIIVNDGDHPGDATVIAKRLAQRDNLVAVTGHWSSSTSLGVVPIYDQQQLPFVDPVSTNSAIARMSDYVFRTVPNNAIVAETMANYAQNTLQIKNLAIFYDSESAYSLSLREQLQSAIAARGGRIIDEFDLTASGFVAQDRLNQIKEQNGEGIVLIPSTTSIDRALQVVNANNQQFPLLGDIGNLYGIKTLEVGENAVGLSIPIPWHIDQPSNSEFINTAWELWGGSVNWATAMTYDAMNAIAQGLQADPTPETPPSRNDLQTALSANDFSAPGVVESVKFLPSGDRDSELIMVEVQPSNPSRSGTGYDFVPLYTAK